VTAIAPAVRAAAKQHFLVVGARLALPNVETLDDPGGQAITDAIAAWITQQVTR
jgi:hypothetical protein